MGTAGPRPAIGEFDMKTLLKLFIAWAAFAVSLVVSGILSRILHLQTVAPDVLRRMPFHLAVVLGAAVLLVLGLYPLASGIAASIPVRAAALVAFVFLALGVNTLFDGVIFTDYFNSIVPSMVLLYFLEALFLGTAQGCFFGQSGRASGMAPHAGIDWLGRGLIAWLLWPVVYLFFGTCVAPIVVPYYQNGSIPGLHIPPMNVILGMQLVRSLFFLAASLPLIALWKGSRRNLWLALGLGHTVTVGIFGLVAANFMPPVLRVVHGIEITCDSFAYAGLLVLLFAAAGLRVEKQANTHGAAA
jgi:uncharacterized membrane protein